MSEAETMSQRESAMLDDLRALVQGSDPIRIEFSTSISLSGGGALVSARFYIRKGQRWAKVGPVLVAPEANPTRAGLLETLAHLATDGFDQGGAA